MRLANDIDRGHVTSSTSDNLKGLFDMLPILRTGEAIIVGEAVSLPVRTIITPPAPDKRPDSFDPVVAIHKSPGEGYDGPGSWVQRRDPSDYVSLVYQWRKQDPHITSEKGETMEMINTPESTNISRFGYDEERQVLRVEFQNGSIYDYYDIPSQVFDEMQRAGSKGSYLAQNIKGRYRYARA